MIVFTDDDELIVRASAVLKSQGPENWSRGRPGDCFYRYAQTTKNGKKSSKPCECGAGRAPLRPNQSEMANNCYQESPLTRPQRRTHSRS